MIKKKRTKALLGSVLASVLAMNQLTSAFIIATSDSVENTFLPFETIPCGLCVTKTVEHDLGEDYEIPEYIEFDFEIEFGQIYSGFEFETSQGLIAADENGVLSVSIKPDEYIIVYDIDEGTQVTVTELEASKGFSTQQSVQTATVSSDVTTFVSFVNTYTPQAVTAEKVNVGGKKSLTGRDWQESDYFRFLLEMKNDDGTWSVLDLETVEYGTQEGFESFDFSDVISNIEFVNVGTYSFRMTELSGDLDGMHYDDTVNAFDIIVTDDDMDGELEITDVTGTANTVVSYDEDNNTYDVSAEFVNSLKTYNIGIVGENVSANAGETVDVNFAAEGFGDATSMQFVISVPSGYVIDDIALGEMFIEGTLSINKTADNIAIVIISNTAISSDSDDFITVSVTVPDDAKTGTVLVDISEDMFVFTDKDMFIVGEDRADISVIDGSISVTAMTTTTTTTTTTTITTTTTTTTTTITTTTTTTTTTTLPAHYTIDIVGENISANAGETVDVGFSATGFGDATSMQFVISVPSGYTIDDIALGDMFEEGTITISKTADNTAIVIISSAVINSNSDDFITVSVTVPDDAKTGTVLVDISEDMFFFTDNDMQNVTKDRVELSITDGSISVTALTTTTTSVTTTTTTTTTTTIPGNYVIDIVGENVSANAGETVDVGFCAEGFNDATSMQFVLNVPAGYTIDSIALGNMIASGDLSAIINGNVATISISDIIIDNMSDDFFTISITVPDDAPDEVVPVDIVDVTFSFTDGDMQVVGADRATVNITDGTIDVTPNIVTTTSISFNVNKVNVELGTYFADNTYSVLDSSTAEFALDIYIYDESGNEPVHHSIDITDSIIVNPADVDGTLDTVVLGKGDENVSPFDIYWSYYISENAYKFDFAFAYIFDFDAIDTLFENINSAVGLNLSVDNQADIDLLDGIIYYDYDSRVSAEFGVISCTVGQRGDATLDHVIDAKDAALMASYSARFAAQNPSSFELPVFNAKNDSLSRFLANSNEDITYIGEDAYNCIDAKDAAYAAKYSAQYAALTPPFDEYIAYYDLWTQIGLVQSSDEDGINFGNLLDTLD